MGNAVFLGESAGVDQSALGAGSPGESQVDAGLVVGLICANTCLRMSGTMVLQGDAFAFLPRARPSFSSAS